MAEEQVKSSGGKGPQPDWVTTTTVLGDLRAGDDAAWQKFVDRFRSPVYGFATSMGLPHAEAEDATQETLNAFVSAIQRGDYNREKGRLSAWLFGFARRTIMATRRVHMSRRDKPASDTGFWRRLPDDESLEHIWDRVWEEELAAACLRQLEAEIGEQAFRAFHAMTVEGRSSKDVAKELGISDSTARVAKHRALQRLTHLRSQYDDSV